MTNAVEVVTDDMKTHRMQRHDLVRWMLAAGAEVTGTAKSPPLRPELAGWPKFRGWAGPCWAGHLGEPKVQ